MDTEEALKLIEREKVNALSAVPMMTRELLAHPDFADYDTSSLNSLAGGGAAMHPDLPNKVVEATERAKPAQGYGMTEVCGISTYTTGDLVSGSTAKLRAACADSGREDCQRRW